MSQFIFEFQWIISLIYKFTHLRIFYNFFDAETNEIKSVLFFSQILYVQKSNRLRYKV